MIKLLSKKPISRQQLTRMMSQNNLKTILHDLEEFAPIRLAESWDNVGLLIEPSTERSIKTIFLTNDLTERVLTEAVNKNSNLIISYHPPIFAPLKRVTQRHWKERIVATCLENGIALYSPHTAWDVTNNGVNDWLSSALPYVEKVPIKPITDQIDIGIGRILKLAEGITLKEAIVKVKQKTCIENVHVSIGNESNLDTVIKTAATCAGSGSSVLKNVQADLYLTGEMPHHEVLDAQAKNISVILCNHSNSERGFLIEFKSILQNLIRKHSSNIEILISEHDADPLKTF